MFVDTCVDNRVGNQGYHEKVDDNLVDMIGYLEEG